MRVIVCALLLSSAACVAQASGAIPPAEAAGSQALQPPPEVLRNAAIRFTVQLGVWDPMLARSPELAGYPGGIFRQPDHLRTLRGLVLEHQPAGASVLGAVEGPSAAQMAEADARLHATDDIFEQAFALEQVMGRHTRLYIPAKDSGALTEALIPWVHTAFDPMIESLPNRTCEAAGSSVCVESLNRFIAVTDEGWGVRIDIAELLWPSLDAQRVLQLYGRSEAGLQQQRATLRRLGHEDAPRNTRSMVTEFWTRAYEAPGLNAAPASSAPIVSAAVDPHALMRLGQALGIHQQYAYELGRALRQATPGLDAEDGTPEYDIPSLNSATAEFPFSEYVAHWTFETDARSIELQWHLNGIGQALLSEADPQVPIPVAAELCVDTSACAVVSESFGGLLNAVEFDPKSLSGNEQQHLLLPVALGAWPNALSKLREHLPTEPLHADGAMAGAAWRDGWGRLEFAVGSWSSDVPTRPVVPSGTRLPVEGGQRHYTQDTNFVVVDSPSPARPGWIAASDLVRAAWLSKRPTVATASGATVRISDLLTVQRFFLGDLRGSGWDELNIDLKLEGEVIRGRVAFAGHREAVGP